MEAVNRWSKCRNCGKHVHELQWGTFKRCPFCDALRRLTVSERIEQTFDAGSFTPMTLTTKVQNQLDFPGYDAKISRSQQVTQHTEAITIGTAKLNGTLVATGVMDAYFMMGTLNTVVGAGIRQIMQIARQQKLPLLLFIVSGGARMQEGIFSLLQMNQILAEQARLNQAGNLSINVLTDPTMGGVSASFGFKSDYVLAEDQAQIGFSGKRVIEQTTGETLPAEFQTAEFLLKHGQLDDVIHREQMREYLLQLLRLHGYGE
jgi:acetyl-CoA carboxylase carboxyl transferase subunit beta